MQSRCPPISTHPISSRRTVPFFLVEPGGKSSVGAKEAEEMLFVSEVPDEAEGTFPAGKPSALLSAGMDAEDEGANEEHRGKVARGTRSRRKSKGRSDIFSPTVVDPALKDGGSHNSLNRQHAGPGSAASSSPAINDRRPWRYNLAAAEAPGSARSSRRGAGRRSRPSPGPCALPRRGYRGPG